MTCTKLNVLAITGLTLSSEKLEELKETFTEVHYYPDNNVPRSLWKDIEVWYTRYTGLPGDVKDVDEVRRTKVVQLASAGANIALQHPIFHTEQGKRRIKVCSASGIHVLSIPQYIIAQIVNLYMTLHLQLYLGRKNQRWASREEIAGPVGRGPSSLNSQSLYGKTAGLLGYGHIARETARMLKALNVKIIAANSTGEKRADEGYIIPGTGDPDGSIPEKYYSTNDEKSFKEFLSRSDILIASLPSTPATRYMLKKEHFDAMPDGSIFINVGRGDLVDSETLLSALNSPGTGKGLYGVALDVTDPEPLSPDHPLWSHPRAIVTPHTSGDFEGYFDAGADLLMANVEKYRKEGRFFNVVDPDKGY